MDSLKEGDKVIFLVYELEIGTITRLGEKTVSITEEGALGYSYMRVPLDHVYPATEENLKRLQEIRAMKKELEDFKAPLRDEISRLSNQIKATAEVKE